jgi:hypothetical protein
MSLERHVNNIGFFFENIINNSFSAISLIKKIFIYGYAKDKALFADCSNFDPESGYSLHSSCFILGCVPDMDDQTLIWAYNLGVQEVPEKAPEYLQAIYEMSKERKSEALEELVAVEKSKGK